MMRYLITTNSLIAKIMAESTGPLQFKGRLGNLIGRQVDGKNIISLPGGFTSEKLKDRSNEKLARVRENYDEYKYSSLMSLAIFRSLKSKTSKAHFHSKASGKLTGKLQILRVMDTESVRGERKPTVGALSLLKDHRLSDSKLNPWLSEPLIQKLDDLTLKVSIPDPSSCLNGNESNHKKMTVKLIVQEIDIPNQKVTNVKDFPQEINLESNQPVEWSATLFPQHSLVSVSTHFYIENNDFKLPLADKKLCSLYIADFFI